MPARARWGPSERMKPGAPPPFPESRRVRILPSHGGTARIRRTESRPEAPAAAKTLRPDAHRARRRPRHVGACRRARPTTGLGLLAALVRRPVVLLWLGNRMGRRGWSLDGRARRRRRRDTG